MNFITTTFFPVKKEEDAAQMETFDDQKDVSSKKYY